MTDIFISYRREEQRECARIADKLRALQYDVWFDARLTSGESFTAEIERTVKSAKVVLVLWSPGAAGSRWVRNEADVGRERDVLVSVQIKPCEMPLEFRDIHFNPLHDPDFADDDPQWLTVLGRIEKLTGRAGIVEFSRARGQAKRQMLDWANAHPSDRLASIARGAARDHTDTPVTPERKSGAGGMLVAGVVSAAVFGAAGVLAAPYVFPAAPAAQPEISMQVRAVELVGAWNEVGLGDCAANALHIGVDARGLVLRVGDAVEAQPIVGFEGGWLLTASGVRYRRDGANLVSQLHEGAAEAQYTPCG